MKDSLEMQKVLIQKNNHVKLQKLALFYHQSKTIH